MVELQQIGSGHPGDQDGTGGQALVLVADGIEIPGNLGTLLRTLDACGGDCLL